MPHLYDGPVIDAHHHLWRYSAAAFPWLAEQGKEALARDFGPADHHAALNGCNVAGTVWIEALAADPLAEAVQAQAWADADPAICNAIIAHCPLDAPDVGDRLDRLKQAAPNLRGVRDIVTWRPAGWSPARKTDLLSDPAFGRGLQALADRDLSFDLMLLPHQIAAAATLLQHHPDLRVIVEHAGSPEDRSSAGRDQWRRGLKQLAALPRSAIKISALHCMDDAWTPDSIRSMVEQVIEAFGVGRTCFGTDFPVHDLTRPAAAALDDIRAALASLSASEQRSLFCDTACSLYRIAPGGVSRG